MDHVFEVYDYEEYRKVQFAAAQLTDHALTWWDRDQQQRRRNREGPVATWEVMKFIMRRRYVPPLYHRELQKKFRRLIQGSRGVEDYYEEFEHLRNRIQLEDDEETLMAQFLDGLHERIVRKVERQTYHGFEELLHLAIQIESQVKRKSASMSRARPQAPAPVPWAPCTPAVASGSRPIDKGKAPAVDTRFRGHPTEPARDTRAEVRTDTNVQRTRDIECFKCRGKGHYARDCPNRRVMIVTASGEIESQDEEELQEEESEEEDEPKEFEYAEIGDILVTRRVLSTAPVPDETAQRENIFHTRCTVSGKVCGIIIDGGSCTNVASTYLVEKLNLPVTRHPRPYRLRWLNDRTELNVTNQVLVSFSIGRYQDSVLCDVVPMQASHLLLGRPWQFDKEAIHNGRTNLYSLVHDKKKYTLAPMLPAQVHELQVALSKNKAIAKSSFLISPVVSRVDCDDELPVGLMSCRDVLSTGTLTVELSRASKDSSAESFPGDIPVGLQPQRGIDYHCDVLGTTSRIQKPKEPPDLVSYTTPYDPFDCMISSLARFGVDSSRLELAQSLGGLDLGSNSVVIAGADWDILSSYVMLATRSSSFAGARRGVAGDIWVKTKPPDNNLTGKGSEIRDFTGSELCLGYCRDLVLRTKPLEEGGNDRDLNLMLVPEHVPEEQLVAEQLGSQEAQRIGGCFYVDCLGVCFAGPSAVVRKSVWTLSCQEDEGLAPPTLH